MKKKILKKKNKSFFKKRIFSFGQIHVLTTLNNTIVNLTDKYGKTIAWLTAKIAGFKGAKKASAYAAQKTSEMITKTALKFGMKSVDVIIKGLGMGRESCLKGICNIGMRIVSITDKTPIAYNGCRARKIRRK